MELRRSVLLLSVACTLPLALCAGAIAAAPAGLIDTQLATPASNPLSSPTAIVPLNAGRALVLEKRGTVRVLGADGTLLATNALSLTSSVCTDSEEGLLGAAIDPAFAQNGFVYLYYTHNAGDCASSTGRFNRVSRFTMTGDVINPASELILLDKMAIPAGNHNGGDLQIGNDGELYVTVGDGGTNPRGAGPSAAQDLSLLNGKILRITTTGGVPPDNPFVGASGATACRTAGLTEPTSAICMEIYDYGLRNPFRFAFDPNTAQTRFFINDVGQSTWEEVDAGGKGLNYGWDIREGFCANGSSTACAPTPALYTDPLTAYNHSTGCLFITGGAFIPNGIWDPVYDGGYLFADGGCGKIFLRSGDGTVDYATPFAQTSGTITDMTFLTHGGVTALYYVTNGSSQLHRITLPAAPPKPPVVQPPTTPPIAPAPVPPRITLTHSATPLSVRAPHGRIHHLVLVESSASSAVTLSSLQDSRYGDLTKATSSTCATGGSIAPGGAYRCTFDVTVSGPSGTVTDTVTATVSGGGLSVAAHAAATVRITPVRCTIVDVRGKLATRARVLIARRHCVVHQIVVATEHGAPVRRHRKLVRATTSRRPRAPAGTARTWTLRVEKVGQTTGGTFEAGSAETIYVGWEATPRAIAKQRGARFL